MTYRFLGTYSRIGTRRLERFGQPIELSDELAREAILGHCPLILEAEFERIGFTREELARYAWPAARHEASPAFLAKYEQALKALHARREALEGGK